ncbi:MAG: ribosome biogenesis GTPase Der [Coriobacteriia bacterium]|nr:ribosome biogenesis GTPase Der [Coriobacteriia bacterium]
MTNDLPIVAVVGSPNVGKSTLINRIAQSEDAIVHEQRGVTRDRSYHEAEWCGTHFLLVDTGGIEMASTDEFQAGIRVQAEMATHEADAIVLVVDGKVGLTADDEEIARLLKRADKPIFLAVNKVDTPGSETETYEFWNLGLGTPWPVSATHGNGTGDLLDEIVRDLPRIEPAPDDGAIKIAVIGRPNAGKSSLTNRLIGYDRSMVSEIAGTTRDAIDSTVERDGQLYRFIDTAGLRRLGVINEDVEYYGFVRAMRAIDLCDVALLVVDSEVGLTDQDQRIANYAKERGCAMVIALNKWDLMTDDYERDQLIARVEDRLAFVSWAPFVRISALSGRKVDKLWTMFTTVYNNYRREISTSQLNRVLTELREFGHTVSKQNRTLRINYMTQTRTTPPGFTFFANHPDLIDDTFARYLENRLRERFDFTGTPIFLRFKRKA